MFRREEVEKSRAHKRAPVTWRAEVSVARVESGATAAIFCAITTPASSAASDVGAITCVIPMRYDSAAIQWSPVSM
jgi:hypothetical protein